MIDFEAKKKLGIVDIVIISIIFILIINIFIFTMIVGVETNIISKIFGASDFKHFYSSSKMIRNGEGFKVYNKGYFENLKEQKDKNIFNINYSPAFFYLFVPLTFLPYKAALIIITIIFIFIYLLSVFLLIKTFKRLENYKFYIILFSLFYPPFIYAILIGQPSVLWIFLLCLSFYYAKKDRLFISGITLSFFILIPNFYILIFLMLLFSFRSRLFMGLLAGSFVIIFLSGIFDLFFLWKQWMEPYFIFKNNYFSVENMQLIRSAAERTYFYPLSQTNKFTLILTYLTIMTGMFALVCPVIYSFRHKNNFSRNSYWFLLSISLVLSSPYLHNFTLIILLLPIIIFLNLLLADRVKNQYIIVILASFSFSIVVFFLINLFVQFNFFIILLWFLLINGMFGKRVREYTPKAFRGYWEDY